jgi:hypothetical protein
MRNKVAMPGPFCKLLLLELVLCLIPFSLGQEKANPQPKGFIAGRVTSEAGEPLAGVRVEWEAARVDPTNADGFYFSRDRYSTMIDDTSCCVIRFSLPGYKSLTKAVNIDDHRLDVVLQSGDNKWSPSVCKSSPEDNKRIGYAMRLLVPDGTLVEEKGDVDTAIRAIYFGADIIFRPEKKRESMIVGSGPLWGGKWPDKHLLISSSVMEERFDSVGYRFDYRGLDKEGKRWRYTGWFGETIEYEKVSDQAADFFDSLIDNMCWDSPARPRDK